MATYKEIADRKHKLIERYRSALLEEVLETERSQATVEAENERFAWKSDFRTRDEIEVLYKERKRWDRRFLVDTFVLGILLLGVVAATPQLVGLVAPRSNIRGANARPAKPFLATEQPTDAALEDGKFEEETGDDN